MEKTLKIIAWGQIVLGGLAILGSFSSEDFYAFVGGVWFLVAGWIALSYIKEVKSKHEQSL